MGVTVYSYAHQDLESIDDLSNILLHQVEEFFVSYNRQRERNFRPRDAMELRKPSNSLQPELRRFAIENSPARGRYRTRCANPYGPLLHSLRYLDLVRKRKVYRIGRNPVE